MSLAKRALAGSIASAVNFGLTFAQAVLVVPILLNAWGKEGYGLWLALTSVQTLLTSLDLGHQAYLGNAFNQDFALGTERLRLRLASGIGVTLFLGVVQCGIFLGLWSSGVLPKLFGVGGETLVTWRIGPSLLVLLVVWAVFGSVSGILVRLYAPYGRFALGQWISTGQRVGQLILLLGVALSGGQFMAYAWGFVIYSIAMAVLWFPALRRAIPELYPWWRGGRFREGWANLFNSGWLTAGTILANLAGSGVTLIMASTLTASAIPAFSTLRTVANVGFQFALVLLNPIMPDVARLAVLGEHSRLREIFSVLLVVAGAPLCLAIALGSPFAPTMFSWWTRGHVEFSPPLYALLVFSVMVRTLSVPFGGYLTALNHVRSLLGVTAVQLGVMLIVSLTLVRSLGSFAFGLGVLAGELSSIAASYLACRRLAPDIFVAGGLKTWTNTLILPLVLAGTHLLVWCRLTTGLQFGLGCVAAVLHLWNYSRIFRSLPGEFQKRVLAFAPRAVRERVVPIM